MAPEVLSHSEATSLYHSLSTTKAPETPEPVNEESTEAESEKSDESEDINSTEHEEVQANTVAEEDEMEHDSDLPTEQSNYHDDEEETHDEVPIEDKMKQLTQEIEYHDNEKAETSDDPQSFLTLSDLIKNLQPAIKNAPQIDSSYSHTMRVLGEQTISNADVRNSVPQTNRALF